MMFRHVLLTSSLLSGALAFLPNSFSRNLRGVSAVRKHSWRGKVSAVIAGGEGRALIIQNKGGGHGELGFHLAGVLESKGISVTMLHDGGPDPKTGKQPWDSYSQLEDKGIEIVWSDVAAAAASLKE